MTFCVHRYTQSNTYILLRGLNAFHCTNRMREIVSYGGNKRVSSSLSAPTTCPNMQSAIWLSESILFSFIPLWHNFYNRDLLSPTTLCSALGTFYHYVGTKDVILVWVLFRLITRLDRYPTIPLVSTSCFYVPFLSIVSTTGCTSYY